MVYVENLLILNIFSFFALYFQLCLCLLYVHSTLFLVSYCCWFSMVFLLFASQSCLYHFERLGNWFQKVES